MRTVDFETLLKGVMSLLTGKSELPGAEEYPAVRAHLDMSLMEAYKGEVWPKLVQCQERYFRANWSAATTYARPASLGADNAANEVFDPAVQRYFQSLRNPNLNNAPTIAGAENAAFWAECKASYSAETWATGQVLNVGDKRLYLPTNRVYQVHTAHTSSSVLTPDATGGNERWGILTAFERYVDFDQPPGGGATPTAIGKVFDVKDANPRVTARWASLDWGEFLDRVYVRSNVVRCWVEFVAQRPRLKGDNWSSASTYAVGQQVFFTPTGGLGNLYDCVTATSAGESPSSAPAKWSVVGIPAVFEAFLIWSAYGKALTGEGQADKRRDALAIAEGYLGLEADEAFRQQGGAPQLAMGGAY